MTRTELEKRYEERGCIDYQLHNLADLELIHGVNVSELPGYTDLSNEHKMLFESSIIRLFNAHGLDSRKCLQPKCIHYVREIEYEKAVSKDEGLLVGIEINITTVVQAVNAAYLSQRSDGVDAETAVKKIFTSDLDSEGEEKELHKVDTYVNISGNAGDMT